MFHQSTAWQRNLRGGLIKQRELPENDSFTDSFKLTHRLSRFHLKNSGMRVEIDPTPPQPAANGTYDLVRQYRLGNTDTFSSWLSDNNILCAYAVCSGSDVLPDLSSLGITSLNDIDFSDAKNLTLRNEVLKLVREAENKRDLPSRVTLNFQTENDMIAFKMRWL